MCKLCTLFRSDKPFRFHRPDEITKGVLIGRKAKKYLYLFDKEVYSLAMEKPIMTAVIGPPGAGKTQLLNYLESTQKEKNRVCIVLNLNDIKVDYDYLVDSLAYSDSLREFFNLHGYNQQLESSIAEKVVEIKETFRKIRVESGNENIGICFLLDAVDEYIRKIKDKVSDERKDIISDLMRTTSRLLDDLRHSCAIFAVTNDVYQEFQKVLEIDTSLQDKFFLIVDLDSFTKEKKGLTLEKLDEDENEQMIEAFLNLWADRNGILLPEHKDTITSSGRNLFPYTRDAINIFWNAGAIPGDICLACLSALDRKLSIVDRGSNDPTHLIITEIDAAWIINQFSSYFNKAYEQTGFEDRILTLLSESRSDYEMQNIISKAKSSYFECSGNLPEAFKSYLEALGENFSIKPGNIHKFVKCKYGLDEDFVTIDLVINYKEKSIGLQFIVREDGKELNKREIHEKEKALLFALKNKQIERGLIILVSDIESEEVQVRNLLKERYEKSEISFDLESRNGKLFEINYFPTISVNRISKNNAWFLLGLYAFIKGNNSTNHLMKMYSKRLEKEIRISSILEKLLKKEATVTYIRPQLPPTCEILYR